MARYTSSSPWFETSQNRLYLDIWIPRPVPAAADDFEYTIKPQYNYRPDLLAYDLYGTPRLWWVFAQRNVDIISDPIYDFRAGITIKLPKRSNLLAKLGLT
jgi:alpha-L-fucosidase